MNCRMKLTSPLGGQQSLLVGNNIEDFPYKGGLGSECAAQPSIPAAILPMQ
jgi:hypothetical protein